MKYFVNDSNYWQVETARVWISLFCVQRKAISRRAFSYGLKHRVENWAIKRNEQLLRNKVFSVYISNENFIRAACSLGFRFRQVRPGSPYAFFNLSIRKEAIRG